jgi:hypothetical protein
MRFGKFHPDGTETGVRVIEQGAIQRCRFLIMIPDHYRDDGSCKCDDAEHRAYLIARCGYTDASFDGIPLRTEGT